MLHFNQYKNKDSCWLVYPIVETWNGEYYKLSIPLHVYRGDRRYVTEIRKGNIYYFCDGIDIIGCLFYNEINNRCNLVTSGQNVPHHMISNIIIMDGILYAEDENGCKVDYACTLIEEPIHVEDAPIVY